MLGFGLDDMLSIPDAVGAMAQVWWLTLVQQRP